MFLLRFAAALRGFVSVRLLRESIDFVFPSLLFSLVVLPSPEAIAPARPRPACWGPAKPRGGQTGTREGLAPAPHTVPGPLREGFPGGGYVRAEAQRQRHVGARHPRSRCDLFSRKRPTNRPTDRPVDHGDRGRLATHAVWFVFPPRGRGRCPRSLDRLFGRPHARRPGQARVASLVVWGVPCRGGTAWQAARSSPPTETEPPVRRHLFSLPRLVVVF
mmetsp:Transcript_55/g.94  ORF Transcript_55/g.94 Transcript_55/m.94 type:complete len:218 (-) Transcript_55:45-698(-)